jgi:hypothetical protein
MQSLHCIATIVDTQSLPSDDFIHCYADQTMKPTSMASFALIFFGRDADVQLEHGHQIVDRKTTAEEACTLLFKDDLSS